MRCITTMCSETYLPQFLTLHTSIRKFSQIPIIVQTTMQDTSKFPSDVTVVKRLKIQKRTTYTDDGVYLASCRPDIVLQAFKFGYTEVLNLGCDMLFMSDFEGIYDHLRTSESVVTPHITDLLPEDGKFPQNLQMSPTGHINADFSLFRDTPQIRKVLGWISEQLETNCVADYSRGLFYEQTYWGFLPYLTNCHILKDPRYNIAYWNYKQRDFRKEEDVWVVGNTPAILYHFSGLTDPKKISKHQNRYEAEGDFLEFLESYGK